MTLRKIIFTAFLLFGFFAIQSSTKAMDGGMDFDTSLLPSDLTTELGIAHDPRATSFRSLEEYLESLFRSKLLSADDINWIHIAMRYLPIEEVEYELYSLLNLNFYWTISSLTNINLAPLSRGGKLKIFLKQKKDVLKLSQVVAGKVGQLIITPRFTENDTFFTTLLTAIYKKIACNTDTSFEEICDDPQWPALRQPTRDKSSIPECTINPDSLDKIGESTLSQLTQLHAYAFLDRADLEFVFHLLDIFPAHAIPLEYGFGKACFICKRYTKKFAPVTKLQAEKEIFIETINIHLNNRNIFCTFNGKEWHAKIRAADTLDAFIKVRNDFYTTLSEYLSTPKSLPPVTSSPTAIAAPRVVAPAEIKTSPTKATTPPMCISMALPIAIIPIDLYSQHLPAELNYYKTEIIRLYSVNFSETHFIFQHFKNVLAQIETHIDSRVQLNPLIALHSELLALLQTRWHPSIFSNETNFLNWCIKFYKTYFYTVGLTPMLNYYESIVESQLEAKEIRPFLYETILCYCVDNRTLMVNTPGINKLLIEKWGYPPSSATPGCI